ncbi:MAG: hypothetical protein R2854_06480 [Caldilineaceae bacterium]
MLTGGIDLSIVGTANLAAIAAAMVLTRLAGDGGDMSLALAVPLAAVVALIVASLCGLFNGFLMPALGITPSTTTLGTSSLYAVVCDDGRPGDHHTTQLAFIGNGSVLGVPYPVIFFILIAAAFAVILNRTVFSFNVYMLRTNPPRRFSRASTSTRAHPHLLAGGDGGGRGGHHLSGPGQFGQARLRRVLHPAHRAHRHPRRRQLHRWRGRDRTSSSRVLGIGFLSQPQHAHAGTLRL